MSCLKSSDFNENGNVLEGKPLDFGNFVEARMDKELAKLLFHVAPDEDPQDVYDQVVFEHRNFFLSKPPVAKLFLGRLKKVNQVQEAAMMLYSDDIQWKEEAVHAQLNPPVWSQNWLVDFGKLQAFRNQVKLQLQRLPHPVMWKEPIENWLVIELAYAELYGEDLPIDSDVLVSKEPDPMLILHELNSLPFAPLVENLRIHSKDLSIALQVERKRLHLYTLLNQKDGN
jgi:hypothetical protein